VAYLNKLKLFLIRAQNLEDAVDAIAGKAEDGVHAMEFSAGTGQSAIIIETGTSTLLS